MLREYETTFVLDPGHDEAQVEAEIEKIREIITQDGGEVVAVNKWGRRKLAYEIRKKKEGIYTLIQFKGNPAVLSNLARRYHLNENLLRHMTVLYEAPPESPAVSPEGGDPGFRVAAVHDSE